MKIKKTKLLIVVTTILSFTQTYVYGQKINWGQAITASKKYAPTIIEEEGNVFYTYDYSNKEFLLEKFDKKNSTNVYSKKYEIPKTHEIKMVMVSNDKIMVFFSFYDNKKKTSEIYCNTYSSSNGMNLKSNLTVSSIYAEASGDYRNDDCALYKSVDNKKILVTNSVFSKKEDTYKMYYILLDEKLSKIFEKTENSGKEKLTITEMIVGNDGSCYFQKNLTGDNGTKLVSLDADKSFEEYEYILDGNKLKVPQNISLRYANMLLNKNGDILLIGQYVKDRIFSGYYFININPKTKQIFSFKINEFDNKLINQFRTQGQIKKGKKARVPDYFNNVRLMAKEDGGIIGITDGVQRFSTQSRSTNQQGFSTLETIGNTIIYHDVMALNFSSDGTLTWANRIPRYQSYSSRRWFAPRKNADYLDCFSALTNDKLYVAYHDKPSNVAITSDNERIYGFRMSKKAVTTLFTIDLKTGQKDKRLFTEGADLETFAEPGTAFQKSQNSDMIMLGSKKTKFKYGVMSFPK